MRKWIFILVLVLAALGAALLVTVGQRGESRVEAWVGSQLKSIVNAGGRFSLEFDGIDYQAPNRIVLKKLRLSLADRGDLGTMIEIAEGTVDLGEVPRWGKPIVVETVKLVEPTVRVESFLAAAKSAGDKTRATTKPSLSSILTLKRVEIENGTIRYDDGKGSPLSWTKLDARLDLETTDRDWHVVRVVIDESPLMTANVAAELNIDAMVARNINVKAMLDLNNPAALQFFTPPLQRLLNKFEVRGRMDVGLAGHLDAKQMDQTNAAASFELQDANVTSGRYHLPVRHMAGTARLHGTDLQIEPLEVETLGGKLINSARVRIDGDRRVRAQAIASNLNLQDLLKADGGGDGSDIAGIVNADIRVTSSIDELRRVARGNSDGLRWGTGYVQVSQGRLVRFPVIEQLMYATRTLTSMFTGKGQNRDSFETQFLLIDNVVDVTTMVYRGDGVGMRGKGRIGMNGEVSLVVNAGPMERIQATLGAVGDFWGEFTDRLMGYSVRGTLKEPVVRPILGS
jgi:hypothetical protein